MKIQISARHKTTNVVHTFTSVEWYSAQQTGDFIYLSSKAVSDTMQTTGPVIAKPTGCSSCGKKNKA